MAVIHGTWFYIHVAYAYSLMLLATILFLRFLLRRPSLYRGQAGMMMLGLLAPWAANGLTALLNPFPTVTFDFTPYGFVVGGLALAWGAYRFRLLDITPIAYETIIENMADGLIVLDASHRSSTSTRAPPACWGWIGIERWDALPGRSSPSGRTWQPVSEKRPRRGRRWSWGKGKHGVSMSCRFHRCGIDGAG